MFVRLSGIILAVSLILCSSVLAEDKNTVLLMHLDEDGGTDAEDSSGEKNHGTIKGGAKWVEGKFGSALEFDGDDDVVVIAKAPSLEITDQITIEAWVKPASFTSKVGATNEVAIVSMAEGGGWQLTIRDGHLFPYIGKEGGGYVTLKGNTPLEKNKWYHLAASFDGESLKVYVDGKLDGETKGKTKISVKNVNVNIGANPSPGGGAICFFTGIIDEVRVSNIARSADEIRQGMNPTAVTPSWSLVTAWGWLKHK